VGEKDLKQRSCRLVSHGGEQKDEKKKIGATLGRKKKSLRVKGGHRFAPSTAWCSPFFRKRTLKEGRGADKKRLLWEDQFHYILRAARSPRGGESKEALGTNEIGTTERLEKEGG